MDDLYQRSLRLALPEVGLQHAVLGMWKDRFDTLADPGEEVIIAHIALLNDADETYRSLYSLLQGSDPNMSAEELEAAPRPLLEANRVSGSQSGKKGKAQRGKGKKGKGKASSSRQDENEQEQGSFPESLPQIREILKGSQYEQSSLKNGANAWP
jgi:hypothetical protein